MVKYEKFAGIVKKQKCPVCKKIFYITVSGKEYGYTIHTNGYIKVFCSYSCMRKYEQPKLEKQKKRIEKMLSGYLMKEDVDVKTT